MTELTITSVCPLCHQPLFPFNQVYHGDRRWHMRLLCKNESCDYNYQFDLSMSPRIFDIFKMDFLYAVDEPYTMDQTSGYHHISLFIIYVIQMLGRTSLRFLGEQLHFKYANLEHYLQRLSEDDLIGFDGKYSQISELGERLLQAALTQKQEDFVRRRHQDFHGMVGRLTDLLMREDIAAFNAERSKLEHVALDLSPIDLSGRVIKHANLRKINLSKSKFELCVFEQCNFNSAVMNGSSFKKTHFADCQIQRADLTQADLASAILEKSFLVECEMAGVNAFHASFKQCNLRSSNLSRANLRASNCTQSDLTRCNLKESDMTGANLWETVLNEADFDRCEMNKVQISIETKFLDARGLMTAKNVSKQLWEKLQLQNKSLPDFDQYRRSHLGQQG
jgi:uncharacterized protein YjbI with pentapeptide repeats